MLDQRVKGAWISESLHGTEILRKAARHGSAFVQIINTFSFVKPLNSGGYLLEQLVEIAVTNIKRLNFMGCK